MTLAHHAAQILRKNRQGNVSSAIIAENDCLPLDLALRALDEPVLALSARSSARPVLQTLALALAVRWEPLDPRDLLAFLVHPVSPVNKRFRTKLAAIVAKRPGIGGSEWNSGIEEHREFLRKKFASDPSALSKALKQAEGDLTQWIAVERFDPLTGAPGDELASTCSAVASWAMAKAAGAELPSAVTDYLVERKSKSCAWRTASLWNKCWLGQMHRQRARIQQFKSPAGPRRRCDGEQPVRNPFSINPGTAKGDRVKFPPQLFREVREVGTGMMITRGSKCPAVGRM
ncbi:MAG: hypothetical protein JO076_12940 [Verrucomicrobia bacterium]|nr:hypothetical protein [Verrucomicrobiota bacterium]